jgi:hypothetical protein
MLWMLFCPKPKREVTLCAAKERVVDVFLEHAARYIMFTPEASLFTDSLPELH